MVGGRVEYEAVGVAQLHAGNHTTHLLASGEDADFLEHFFAREEHAAEEAFHVDFVAFTKLAQPVDEVEVGVEEVGVVQRQVGGGDGHSPVEVAGIGLHVAVDDLEESGHGTRVAAEEHNLVAFLYVEVDILEEHHAFIGGLGEAGHFEYLVTGFALGREDDARVFAGRRTDLFDVEFLEHLLAAGGLLALCHVGAESADELFELALLLFCLGFLVLLLTEGELAGFVPEAVVTGKEVDLAVVDVDGMGTHGVEEVTVVAHHEHGVFEVAEVFLQPGHGLHVEVVGGLIEQQVVGVTSRAPVPA